MQRREETMYGKKYFETAEATVLFAQYHSTREMSATRPGRWIRLVDYLRRVKGIRMKRSRISEILITAGLSWRHEETWFGERVKKREPSKPSPPARHLAALPSVWQLLEEKQPGWRERLKLVRWYVILPAHECIFSSGRDVFAG